MPKLTASLETAETFASLPRCDSTRPPYLAHVKAEKEQLTNKTDANGNPATMVALQFEIDEPEYAGREVPGMGGWYYIMTGGNRSESTDPHNLSRLFDTINALGATWTCTLCGATTSKKFIKEKVKASYHYVCPNCGKRASVSLDGSWVGLSCRVGIDEEKMQNSDEMRNVVTRLYPRND